MGTRRTDFSAEFGRRLRAAMVLQGLSTGDLAELLDTSQITVQRHLRGDHVPDFELITIYAEKLGVSMDSLNPRANVPMRAPVDARARRDSNPQPSDHAAESSLLDALARAS